MQVGTKVRYKTAFLRSTGMLTGHIPHARGIVTSVKTYGKGCTIAKIDWNNPEVPESVNAANLEKIK